MFERLFGQTRREAADVEQTSVPLDVIAKMVEAGAGQVQRAPNRIAFNGFGGSTVIEVTPVHQKTSERLEVEAVVHVRTELNQAVPLDERMVAVINTMASFGALFREPKSGHLIVGSRISVFRDDDVWRLYAPLVAFAAILQADTLLQGLATQLGRPIEPPMQLPEQGAPSRWTAAEFEATVKMLSSRRLLANGGEGGLTVEFPWEPGAISALQGHKTSLLQCRSDEPHPVLGNGLFFKLDLPPRMKEEQLPPLVNLLNAYEWMAVDAVPFLGAWCSDFSSGLLCFVGFWPNFIYQSGTVSNIAIWMMHRSNAARQILERRS